MRAGQNTSLEAALRAVGLSPEAARRLVVADDGERLSSHLAVDEVGIACIGAALLAAAALHESRGEDEVALGLDVAGMRAALRSERFFRIDGRAAGAGFAPQSRFWAARDGWVRTHANFPWHHEALLRALEAPDDDAVAEKIGSLPAERVENLVFAARGVAAAVRTAAEWRRHPQGAAVAAEPLVWRQRLGDARPRRRLPVSGSSGEVAPAAGVRVLDLTRVIAGPVCSRYLGALGAEVLRLDPPHLPDLELGQPADTLLGKRSAIVDFDTADGVQRLEALLGGADVVLSGYRPGALARFGLAPADLARRHPGLVVVQLAAWGHSGPWAERRGFDSIVQAATGIAVAEAGDEGVPGALPCQLLDHGTGYLAAAATLDGLREQERNGGSQVRRLSLARTAHWLLQEPAREASSAAGTTADDSDSFLKTLRGPVPIAAVAPPGSLDDRPLHWPEPVTNYGVEVAEWRHPPEPTRQAP